MSTNGTRSPLNIIVTQLKIMQLNCAVSGEGRSKTQKSLSPRLR